MRAPGAAAEDGGGVGPDPHEEGVAERDLAGETGEDVQSEGGDDEYGHPAQDPEPIVGSEEPETGEEPERDHDQQDEEKRHDDPFAGRGQERLVGLVGGEEERPASHVGLIP